MSGIPTQRTAIFDALSAFWRRLFADRDQLKELMGGVEEGLGQAYLDLMHTVLNMSLDTTPIYHKEYWRLLTLREDNLRYDPDAAFGYSIVLGDDIAKLPLLTNLILNPTVALEEGLDHSYDFATRTLSFEFNPFDNPRLAVRQVSIEPTVYTSGTDATIDLDTSVVRVSFAGTLRSGRDGQLFGTDEFRSAGAGFTQSDVGRSIEIGTAPITLAIIDRVVSEDFAILDTVVGDTGSALSWRVFTDSLFSSFNAGDGLLLQDPVSLDETGYTISSAVDGLTITTESVLEFERTLNRGVRWTHQSAARVREIGFWAPNAEIDRQDLYLNYGYLVRRQEDSTESYKALLQGIFQYFILGPSLPRIAAALNVFVGVPVVRNMSETVIRIDTESTDFDVLTTDLERYELPSGSLRTDLVVGSVLAAFEVLTTIFRVEDYTTNPAWFHTKSIPTELVENLSVQDRAIDPDMLPLLIGGDWSIGDPTAFIGADETGRAVPLREGLDGYTGPNAQSLVSYLGKSFVEEDVGKVVEVESTLYDITAAGLTGTDLEKTFVQTSNNIGSVLAAQTGTGEVPVTATDRFELTSGLSVKPSDEGRLLFVSASSNPALTATVWRIVRYLSSSLVEIVYGGVDAAPVPVSGDTFTVAKMLSWKIPTRPPYKHGLGYTLMRDYIQHHTAFISYEFNAFPDVPFIRSDSDIQEVLLQGKPSYVYFFIEGSNRLEDVVAVSDEQELTFEMNPVFVQQDSGLTIGGEWSLGDFFFHGGPEATPFEILVREADFGGTTTVDIEGSQDVDEIIFVPLYAGDPTATITLNIEAFNGTVYAPISGGNVTFDAAVGQQLYRVETHGLQLRVSATVTGTPTQPGVVGMLRTTPPRVVVRSLPVVATSDNGSTSGDELQDASVVFYALDLLRDVYVTAGGVETLYRIATIVAGDTVTLVNSDGTAAVLATAASVTWTFGAPLQYGCPITIGQGTVDTQREGGVSNYHLVDWPLLPKFVP